MSWSRSSFRLVGQRGWSRGVSGVVVSVVVDWRGVGVVELVVVNDALRSGLYCGVVLWCPLGATLFSPEGLRNLRKVSLPLP
jgi:hypothetical protein